MDWPFELRTNKNFPIVRTVIAQRAHIFSLGYQYSDTLSFHIALPLIKQATDHISSIPDGSLDTKSFPQCLGLAAHTTKGYVYRLSSHSR
jgi:hypothetical protein